YKRVAREALSVLDPNIEYEAHYTTSKTQYRNELEKLTKDYRGYINIHSTVAVITGQLTPYPKSAVDNDFIIVRVKRILMNPHNREVKRSNHLIIYENLKDSGKGVESHVRVHR